MIVVIVSNFVAICLHVILLLLQKLVHVVAKMIVMTNSHCCSILQQNAIVELMLLQVFLIGNAILFVLFLLLQDCEKHFRIWWCYHDYYCCYCYKTIRIFLGRCVVAMIVVVTRLQETSILKCDVAIQYNMRLLSESAKLPFSFLDNLEM